MLWNLLATACFLATAQAVTPLTVTGKDFVNSQTRDRFQVLGVDYQPGGSSGFNKDQDPLSDPRACLRDAALMQRLGVNTIRIYNLFPGLDHDECASIFNAAGIYIILDVNSPLSGGHLDRTGPQSTYNTDYFTQVFGVVEAFKNFPNTLAFFAGNEVINEQSVKSVPAYIRAIQRDIKDYIKKNLDRTIPVGYAAADVRPMLTNTLNYMMCSDEKEPSSSSDIFGLNTYSWCGNSSVTTSGYDVLTADFANATIPVFFSEYGCNEVQPRYFTEVEALYGDAMSQSFSGGLIYEYSQEGNNYGLVQLNANGSATLRIDYENLRIQYTKLDMKKVQTAKDSQTSARPPPCKPDLIQKSNSNSFLDTFDLPARPPGVQDMIDRGLKGARTGQLVDVSSMTIPQTIYDHAGKEMSGIRLKVLASGESNAPGETTSSSSSGSSSSSNTKSGSGSGSSRGRGKSGAGSMALCVPFVGMLTGVSLVASFLL